MVHLGTIEESDHPCSVVEAFRSAASRSPDRLAVRDVTDSLSYSELEKRSQSLAHKLVLSGVRLGEPVGLVCERSIDLIVALLGILKSGGSYLPLDSTYPAERLRFLAEDAGVRFVIGSENALPLEDVVWISPTFSHDAPEPGDLPNLTREDPAYLLYTSGSTGEPKGVVVPHRAVLRLVLGNDFAELGPETHILQHSPISFDASTFEIWGPLLNGGQLTLFPEAPLTLRSLGEAITSHKINTLWLTAGLFHAMVDERIEDFSGLDQLLAGGDVLSPARVGQVVERFPDLRLVNGYGPTENTTFTCCHQITPRDVSKDKPVPIGKPIQGTDVFLLNESLEPVPEGDSGELCAAGPGLALGYWKRDELTAERFVPAPWDKNLLLYRTGDLAHRDDQGLIHFEGRIDQQVKVRGYRLELAEIEAALETHESVEKAVVTTHPSKDEADKKLTGWIVSPSSLDAAELTRYLTGKLPEYAIPSSFQQIESVPLTPNGKVDRRALQASSPIQTHGPLHRENSLVESLVTEITGIDQPPQDANFFDLGMSSLEIARLHEKLEQALGRDIPITTLFQHTTIHSLRRSLEGAASATPITTAETGPSSSDIAIVGMAGRFPGAPNVETFWKNLVAGRETITHFSEEELEYSNDPNNGDSYVRSRGIVEGSDLFDAKHFGIPPRDAELLDPQHRLLLECAQETLENAGHDPDRFEGKIGFFAGSSQNSYLLNNLCADRAFARRLAAGYPVNDFGILFGNDKDFLPTRIAYKLNLRGPAMAVQCACSTSLVAVTQAIESLRSGTSDMALAGGISLTFPQKRDYLYTPEGMASSDGHCRSFDASASGTVFGEGVGLVALRRLDEALADGDEVIAVIKGFALNNDGADKAGYAAPSVSGQVDMILEAHRNAGVDARSIGYLEAHGTGTPLGDPIEVAALTEAFSRTTSDKDFCALGTAKTNVGHLDIAAGVTGLIKAALTLQHGVIPPLVHFEKPNPKIDFEKSALYPVREATEWKDESGPRRAGVSALGVGGTNVHVVLEESPKSDSATTPNSAQLFFPLSATSSLALTEAVERLGDYLRESDASLADVAFTMQEGRREFEIRTAFAARTREELSRQCREFEGKTIKRSSQFEKLAFLFPGQGAQHPGMARDLYEKEAPFRKALDECAAILEPKLGLSLIDLIVPPEDKLEEMATTLRDTSLAQPAIFSVSYALAKQWEHWGIEPDVLVGHSIGEFAAATIAGVFTLADALHLIAERGRLMSELPGGVMISVRASEEEIQPYLTEDYDLAAINGAKALVLAGPHEGSEELEKRLADDGFIAKRLHTSHAFHSRMMDPAVETFEKAVHSISLRAPNRKIFSTVLVDWLSDEQAMDAAYWAAHLRKPVRFYDAIAKLWEDPSIGFLEVGPGNTLATLAGQNPDRNKTTPSLSSLPHPAREESSQKHILSTAANLWSYGWKTDWSKLEQRGNERRHRVPLPTYPFQRERFWVEPPEDEVTVRSEEKSSTADKDPESSPNATGKSEVERLREIFSELSGLAEADLAVDATFLELGLDSLLLTQASRELQESFGVKITLRELIDRFSTIEALAGHLQSEGIQSQPQISVPTPKPKTPSAESPEPVSAPALKLTTRTQQELNPKQRRHLDDLIARYTEKTAESKRLTAKHRKAHADPRTASGFNREWKEMVYQIVTERSKGSRLLDVDGNEYIDILNGFGPGFLGHSPDFLTEAIEDQLHRGFEVGPNQRVAMEAAELFCEVTGNERTSFVCTGSEAVQASMRLARTVTGRDKIVIFARDYHGNFDEVLIRGVNGKGGMKSLPVAPGIPKRAAEDMIVLPYGTDESLELIRSMANELAAVIVEPVQSRRPEFRPRDFVREVREITRQSETLFVFDEVVTGFRFGPGGAQDYYGVDADLATYGKVVGGGMPVGVVSGKAEFMDTFDGGDWNYGDESFPEKPVTFFAGTFVRHPLAMASLKAMLSFFKQQPMHFWQALNAKGDRLAGTVDQFFKDHHLPYELPNRGSLMFARVGDDQPYGNLLFYHLRERGVFLLEGFPSYLTASHSDDDIDHVIDAFRSSASELQEAGFFPESEPISSSAVSKAPATLTPYLSIGKEPPVTLKAGVFEIPTTQPQQEIVVASSLGDSASCAFNESASLVFRGPLKKDALRKAIDELTQRHDALRATFSEDGTTMRIHRDLEIDFSTAENLDDTLRHEAASTFDLATGPLMRMRLVQEEEDHHTLVMTAHHAIVDGWSYNVIAEELATLYNAHTGTSETPRFAEPKQFAEHSREEERFAASESWKQQRDYWLGQFSEIPPSITLPLDRPYPSDRAFSGGTVTHRIGESTYQRIKKAGASQGATLYGTLSAVFALFLHRICRQDELVYCIPAAGQNDGENTENLIGHCVNFLPLRSHLKEDDSFATFLKRNRDIFLGATDNRSYTYGELIRDLKVERDHRRMPLSEVAFNLERMDYFGEWNDLEVEFEPNAKAHVHYTLFLNIVESTNGLRLDLDYNGDVLDRSTVDRWIRQFETLIESVIENSESNAHALALFPNTERETVLNDWSGLQSLPHEIPSVTEVFSLIAPEHSERTALEHYDSTLTYAELEGRANLFAAALQARGVVKGDHIGLLMDRSPDLVVTILAILKTGAAYVPIDPSYPESRIHWMIEDCSARFVITDQNNLSYSCPDIHVQDLETAEIGDFKPVPTSAEDPAYLIYTSGSTGTPKGTVIPHRGIVRLVRDTDYIHFGPEETFLLSSPVSFDASTLEIWGPLLNGGRLALLPPGPPSLAELGAAISDFKVTTLWLTAGLFQLMVDERLDDLKPLRQLLAGGDVVSRSHAARAIEALGPEGRLYNGYGPTENTTFSTVHPISLEDTTRSSIPIGKPICGTTAYLLDSQLKPVPTGMKGRLYFGGAGLALGYLNQPELTGRSFIAHPFEEGGHLYDSGDFGRWLPDGSIEFLGRADDQVKIRGYRIETGEIEGVLEECASVRSAALVVAGETAEEKQLLAFILPEPGHEFSPDSLRRHTRERLPGYMIPNRILVRTEFPLTANGKIDYRKLKEENESVPEENPASGVVGRSDEAPVTEIEKAIAALWCEILGIEKVERNDDFFDLGGHSLAGLRLFTRLQSKFEIDLPLATLFQYSTVATLSTRISENLTQRDKGNEVNLLTLIRTGDKNETPLFLVHGGDGGTLFYKDFADELNFAGEVYTIEAPVLIDPHYRASTTDLRDTATHYLSQIRERFPDRPILLGGYSFGGTVAYEMASQLEKTKTPVETLILFDTPNPAREQEFKNGFPSRLVSDWKSQDDEVLLKQVKRFGVHLIEGFQNKVEYLNHIRTLKREHSESLDLPEHLKILKIQEDHRKLIEGYEPSRYEGRTFLFRALIQSGAFNFNRSMGWNNLIPDLEVIDVTGNHEIIFNDPHVQTLSRHCSEIFARNLDTILPS
ncbi:MAG: amino acid adenylation domain-containing protein [Verrucomicrobiota bacterium]